MRIEKFNQPAAFVIVPDQPHGYRAGAERPEVMNRVRCAAGDDLRVSMRQDQHGGFREMREISP